MNILELQLREAWSGLPSSRQARTEATDRAQAEKLPAGAIPPKLVATEGPRS